MSKELIDFTNKKVLVTGGTKGIGKKLVEDFRYYNASEVHYTSRADIDDPHHYQVDFTDVNELIRFCIWVREQDFDVVINNAGTNKIGPIEDYDSEDYRMIIDLNLVSCFEIMKAAIGTMKQKGYGRIVNITSISSEISMPLRSAYCSSKFGLVGLTKACAVESASHGVLINSVGPGVTETELTVDVLGREKMDEIAQGVPAKRLGTVRDVSNVVLFMASEANSYMVGQNVLVDGGYTCV
jgi:NAD(P)-dependent dehydrogenase (short-subunit alcohol dehydrogenase family)